MAAEGSSLKQLASGGRLNIMASTKLQDIVLYNHFI